MVQLARFTTSSRIGVAMLAIAVALLGYSLVPTLQRVQAGTGNIAHAAPEARADTTAPPASASAVYGRVRPSIARIQTTKGMGSGAYIGNGLVLTVAHLFPDGKQGPNGSGIVVVQLDSGHLQTMGTVLGADRAKDIAVLRLQTNPDVPALVMQGTGAAATGQKAFLVGYPLGLSGSPLLTEGIIARVGESPSGAGATRYVEHTIVGPPGSSGSPILDAEGRIIGVHQAEFVDRSQSSWLGAADRVGLYRGLAAEEIVTYVQRLTAASARS